MKYFLDSNIYIYLNKKQFENIAAHLAFVEMDKIKIPSMVAAELFHGAYKSEYTEYNLARLNQFLSRYETVPFGEKAADCYGRIRADLEREGCIIGYNDMVIAATVLANEGVLVTRNVREFSRIKGLNIEDWSETN